MSASRPAPANRRRGGACPTRPGAVSAASPHGIIVGYRCIIPQFIRRVKVFRRDAGIFHRLGVIRLGNSGTAACAAVPELPIMPPTPRNHKKERRRERLSPLPPLWKADGWKNRLDLTHPYAEKIPVSLRSTENDQRELRQKKHRRFPIRETSAHTPAYPYTTERAPAVGDPLLCKSSDSRRGEFSPRS